MRQEPDVPPGVPIAYVGAPAKYDSDTFLAAPPVGVFTVGISGESVRLDS